MLCCSVAIVKVYAIESGAEGLGVVSEEEGGGGGQFYDGCRVLPTSVIHERFINKW